MQRERAGPEHRGGGGGGPWEQPQQHPGYGPSSKRGRFEERPRDYPPPAREFERGREYGGGGWRGGDGSGRGGGGFGGGGGGPPPGGGRFGGRGGKKPWSKTGFCLALAFGSFVHGLLYGAHWKGRTVKCALCALMECPACSYVGLLALMPVIDRE